VIFVGKELTMFEFVRGNMKKTLRTTELESCSNPLKRGKSCSSQWKKIFIFGCQFFCWCLHDGSMFMHILFIFGWRHQALDVNTKSHFLTQLFIGNYAIIRVFGRFHGLPSISGSKIMAKMPQIN